MIKQRRNAVLHPVLHQAARLAGLEEFQRQKERLTSNMESLEKQLASREEQHRAALHSLEMKALLEKKRWRILIDSCCCNISQI